MYRQQQPIQPNVVPRPQTVERVGRIVAVTGAHAVILIDAEDSANRQGEATCQALAGNEELGRNSGIGSGSVPTAVGRQILHVRQG